MAWELTGNSGTNPTTDFVGTTDNQPLAIGINGTERVRVDTTGNVGIGTSAPGVKLEVSGGIFAHDTITATTATATNSTPEGGHLRVLNSSKTGATANDWSIYNMTGGYGNGLAFWRYYADGTNPGPALFLTDVGNVGIGTSSPATKLHVNGDITVTGDVLLTGADCAEHFDIIGTQIPEPGTVVVIDEAGALRESLEPYDKKVAGVVSGAETYSPGLVLDNRPSGEPRVALALVGKVYCKVDAEYSPIEVGDLLTTSPTPGHAMKAMEPAKAFGSIIGKALRTLDNGKGLIPILIALQ